MRSHSLRLVLPVVAAAGVLLAVPAAQAGHRFSDVPDENLFHTEIGVFAETNITAGCTRAEFCPEDVVRRQAMAAFLTRALGLVVRPNETSQSGVPGSRVAMLDDDVSFAGTASGALELSHAGFRALRLEGNGGAPNVIGGDPQNSVTAGVKGATIAGGGSGSSHLVSDDHGTVGGGDHNQAGDGVGTLQNRPYATVGGGEDNVASGADATVAGGEGNTASGTYSSVPGGVFNVASGSSSFAAGRRATAGLNGAFVWADSTDVAVAAPAVNSFTVRAGGGIWLGTTSVPSIPAGRFLNTSTQGYLSSTGVWTDNSDRAAKTAFSAVDGRVVLRRLAELPVTRWSYRGERSVRHIGPVAQDFARLFRVGQDDRHLAALDANGVALAAIQQLDREKKALAARVAKLERLVATLAERRR